MLRQDFEEDFLLFEKYLQKNLKFSLIQGSKYFDA